MLFLAFSCHTKVVQKKPNILFFLVDDMGWMDAGFMGSKVYETPNVDQLAAEGVRFADAYVTHPRCVPSRYSIQTGKYPARIKSPGPGKMQLEEYTIAEALRDAGYSTFFTGKWHLSMGGESFPETQGYDVNIAGGKRVIPYRRLIRIYTEIIKLLTFLFCPGLDVFFKYLISLKVYEAASSCLFNGLFG